MIRLFDNQGHVLIATADDLAQKLPSAVWIDLLNPNDADYLTLKRVLDVQLPSHDEISEIQISSQLYAEAGTLYMTAPIMAINNENKFFDISALTLILTPERLITLRYLEPKSIEIFAERAQKKPDYNLDTPMHALLGLLETMVDRSVDILEKIGDRLDSVSKRLFRANRTAPEFKADPDNDLRALLTSVGHTGDLLNQFRSALAGCERIAIFLAASADCKINTDNYARLQTLQQDTRVLEQHCDALQERTTFILDAVLGVVSIEQNDFFKILSILSSVFMPPTLIAGIYGMNFEHMPELKWHAGYPLAILAILTSALLPLLYFKKKGWL